MESEVIIHRLSKHDSSSDLKSHIVGRCGTHTFNYRTPRAEAGGPCKVKASFTDQQGYIGMRPCLPTPRKVTFYQFCLDVQKYSILL